MKLCPTAVWGDHKEDPAWLEQFLMLRHALYYFISDPKFGVPSRALYRWGTTIMAGVWQSGASIKASSMQRAAHVLAVYDRLVVSNCGHQYDLHICKCRKGIKAIIALFFR